MQRVDLANALGMLDLPHPLLADDMDLHRVGAARLAQTKTLAPQKNMMTITSSGTTTR